MANRLPSLWEEVVVRHEGRAGASIVDNWIEQLREADKSEHQIFAAIIQALEDAPYLSWNFDRALLASSPWIDASNRLHDWKSQLGG